MKMKKEQYEKPIAFINEFKSVDVITTSDDSVLDGTPDTPEEFPQYL